MNLREVVITLVVLGVGLTSTAYSADSQNKQSAKKNNREIKKREIKTVIFHGKSAKKIDIYYTKLKRSMSEADKEREIKKNEYREKIRRHKKHSKNVKLAGKEIFPNKILPIRTQNMTPGRFSRIKLKRHQQQAMFLIGSDEHSLQWLDANRERLKKLNAVGILLQAETQKDLDKVAKQGSEFHIVKASGVQLANNLGIKKYPALIYGQYVEQ